MANTEPGPSRSIRLGLWGTFDLDRYGPALTARVIRHELAKRLPDADLRSFAPYGHRRPVRSDAGDPAEPLGAWNPARPAELARELDCVIVTGDVLVDDHRLATMYGVDEGEVSRLAFHRYFVNGLGETQGGGYEPGGRGATAWWAVRVSNVPTAVQPTLATALAGHLSLSVTDRASRQVLIDAGAEREVSVVPDPLMALAHAIPVELLAKRLSYLRVMGWYPASGSTLVVAGDADLANDVDAVSDAVAAAASRSGSAVVLAELDPRLGARAFGDQMSTALSVRDVAVHRLPAVACHEDVVAAISAGIGFVGTSRAGAITALAFGRPGFLLGPTAGPEDDPSRHPIAITPSGLAGLLPGNLAEANIDPPMTPPMEIEADVAQAFDALAVLVTDLAARRRPPPGSAPQLLSGARYQPERIRALELAHQVRGERMAAERVVFAERIADLEAALAFTTAHARHLQAWGDDQLRWREEADTELAALRETRTFRWTESIRTMYGRVRRRVGRQ